MENQVQQLEELLARVKRNRVRMATDGNMVAGRSHPRPLDAADAPSVPKAESVAADVDSEASVIDLVHPTSKPPAPDLPRAEDDFSAVAPVSMAPAAVAPADDTDVSTELPPSMAPVAPSMRAAEDDFSSVAPVSAAPAEPAPSVAEDESPSMEIPPSMLPDNEPSVSLSTPEDSDELELVNSDTASMNPGMPQEATSYALDDAEVAPEPPPEVKPQPAEAAVYNRPEIKSFQRTATASGEVVAVRNDLPKQKSYTIDAVLRRAWQLGRHT